MALTTRLNILMLLVAWGASTMVGGTAAPGDVCQKNADCSTNRCFQGFSLTKVCACNSDTNAGCSEGEICSDDPILYDGLPECRMPGNGPVGAECDVDSDCTTLRCFYGFQPPNTPGSCQCNPGTNAGCSDGEICSDDPIAYDGPPECRKPGDGQIGAECEADSDCTTLRCYRGLRPPNLPGLCQCNSDTNAGCPDDEICSDDPIAYDGPPECRKLGDGQVGDECEVDSDCSTLRCFYGEQLPGTPGSCQCNPDTSEGCPEGKICSDDPIAYDGLPVCQDPCKIDFILYNANTDKALHTLKAREYKQNFPLSIVARPSRACGATGSARMTLSGRINTVRTENGKPYAVFGDEKGDFNGRNFRLGDYTVNAELYSGRRNNGDLIASASFDFAVVKRNRRLRSE